MKHINKEYGKLIAEKVMMLTNGGLSNYEWVKDGRKDSNYL